MPRNKGCLVPGKIRRDVRQAPMPKKMRQELETPPPLRKKKNRGITMQEADQVDSQLRSSVLHRLFGF